MNALVTGSHGFAGTHLRRLLRERGWNVTGLGREPRGPSSGETYHALDLTSPEDIRRAVADSDPEIVFHLAARAGGRGEEADRQMVESNVVGTRNLFDALLDRGKRARVVVAGSSAQYGAVPESIDPVDESAPQCPMGVYGWSKTAAETVACAFHGRGGIEVIATRPFNHTGPGEPEHLAPCSFARQIAEIEAGGEPVLSVGNLSPVRDFTDVRDIVRGYVGVAENGTPGRVYNLCSGIGHSIEDVLRMLLDNSRVTIEVRADSGKMRSVDLPRQVGAAERMRNDVGWEPEIPIARSFRELLEDRRRRITSPKGSAP